jgi:hypothetical protein
VADFRLLHVVHAGNSRRTASVIAGLPALPIGVLISSTALSLRIGPARGSGEAEAIGRKRRIFPD